MEKLQLFPPPYFLMPKGLSRPLLASGLGRRKEGRGGGGTSINLTMSDGRGKRNERRTVVGNNITRIRTCPSCISPISEIISYFEFSPANFSSFSDPACTSQPVQSLPLFNQSPALVRSLLSDGGVDGRVEIGSDILHPI